MKVKTIPILAMEQWALFRVDLRTSQTTGAPTLGPFPLKQSVRDFSSEYLSDGTRFSNGMVGINWSGPPYLYDDRIIGGSHLVEGRGHTPAGAVASSETLSSLLRHRRCPRIHAGGRERMCVCVCA